MRKLLLAYLFLAFMPVYAADDASPRIKLSTTSGDIILELDRSKAPGTIANFLDYVKSGFYNGTIFHRVIGNFMIQGGGFSADFQRKKTRATIKNEAGNGLKNLRGTVAMARTRDPHSASSQFFINVVDNHFLDFKSPTSQGWGYSVFGKVVAGMDTVDKIRTMPTGPGGPFPRDVPLKTITIIKAEVVEHAETEKTGAKQ
ncbi:MAG: peptidylprolyl isomerase [Gammaproteobacteria bacterium]|nr:MAG: peptidylprolyl isomerase [Gammaproteobacteria bacterium]